MPYATITGQLKDSDGTAWKQATWTAVPVSPSSKPVFPDGTPVPTTSGLLDDTGHFSGQLPQTIDIRPPGTTLTITLTSMTSAPPVTVTKVQIVAATVDVGALLSPRIVAPRIKSGPINYAYNSTEITNPVHGNGYVNTYENVSYIYMQNSWVKIGASPNFDLLTADTIDCKSLNVADPLANLSKARANYGWVPSLNRSRIISVSETAQLGQYEFSAADANSNFRTYLIIDQDTGAQFSTNFVMSVDNAGASVISPASGLMLAHNMGGQHRTAFINGSPSGGGFAWYAVPGGIGVNSSTSPLLALDPTTRTLRLGAAVFLIIPDNANAGQLIISQQNGGGGALYDSHGVNTGNYAGHTFRCNNVDGSGYFDTLQITSAAGGAVNITGTLHVTGAISSDAGKAFKISHPLDESKILMHGCIEGPEFGVYYRGEAELVDGRAIVELPDYFEALTFPDDRTVLLTQVDDGGELALLAASRVVDGKFSIRSNVSAALVSWEVKAVRRAGVDRLDVIQAKTGERSESES